MSLTFSQKVRGIFRKPKGLLILILTALAVVAGLGVGLAVIAPGLIAAGVVAMLIDAPILRWREGRWSFPTGALLTGMIVAMVLSPHEPWQVAAATSALGVISKYLFRTRRANVFNPAALALVVTFPVFHPGQDWWGAMPEMPPGTLGLLVVTGLFITQRVNKVPGLLAFLGCYYLLFTLTAFLGEPARVAEIYRAPDLQAVLFFAFFMVTDPPTSPPRHRDQLIYGAIAALGSYAVFELIGAAYFLPAGLLVANVWEAWRRSHRHPGAPVSALAAG